MSSTGGVIFIPKLLILITKWEISLPFNRGKWASCSSHTFIIWNLKLSSELGCLLQEKSGSSCICPLLWSDPTVASYSFQSSSRVASSFGVSPALLIVAADGIFIAEDIELGFSQAGAIYLPSGHWRLFIAYTFQRHIPGTTQRQCCMGPCACICPGIPAPRRGPWDQKASRERGWCACPCCLSTNVTVQCPGAWSLATLLVCTEWGGCSIVGNAIHSLVHSLIHSTSAYWTSAVCHPALSLRSSESNEKHKVQDHYNLVCRVKKSTKFTIAAALFSEEWDSPYQGNALSSRLSSFVDSSPMGAGKVSYSLFCMLPLVTDTDITSLVTVHVFVTICYQTVNSLRGLILSCLFDF